MSVVYIVDGDGGLTLKEFDGVVKMKDYFRHCKSLTKGKYFTPEMIDTMAEEIRDVICPCCLEETGFFELIVGVAHKKKMITLDEDGGYTVCVGCLKGCC